MSSVPRRPTRRQQQAAETRRLIVAAARRLFATQGYAATSIAEIAEEAGVAVPTIYASVGPKPRLVQLLNDLIDDEAGVGEIARTMATARDGPSIVAAGVGLTRRLNERCGDIIAAMTSAAASEPDVAIGVAEGMRRHWQGTRGLVQRLSAIGALRPGLDAEEAATAWALLTAPASYAFLTQAAGWSFDQCEAWLVKTLAEITLAAP